MIGSIYDGLFVERHGSDPLESTGPDAGSGRVLVRKGTLARLLVIV